MYDNLSVQYIRVVLELKFSFKLQFKTWFQRLFYSLQESFLATVWTDWFVAVMYRTEIAAGFGFTVVAFQCYLWMDSSNNPEIALLLDSNETSCRLV